MELNARKLRILKAIVDDYIISAVPVGSRTITKKYMSELSPATIRNEMADLEEMGFLESPHTSAGRIPSYKAYRLYVDSLMNVGSLNSDETGVIKRYFDNRFDEMEKLMRSAAHVISNMTNYISVAIAPQMEKAVLRRIQFVPLTSDTALVVIVTDVAIFKDIIIRIPESLNSQELAALSETLSRRFQGKALHEISLDMVDQLCADLAEHHRFLDGLVNTLQRRGMPVDESVVVDGTMNILQHPEYRNDLQRVQSFLMAMDSKEKLYKLLSRSAQWEFKISIGPENEMDALKDMSLVTATYSIGDQTLGTLGVIGPMRMDYDRVLRILNYMGKSVGEILSGMLEDRGGGEG